MFNHSLLSDISLEQQEILCGGTNSSNNEDDDFDKFKDKDKLKNKNITNFMILQKDIRGPVNIKVSL
ncbi:MULTISPECIES: hypothetical protein [unclassified Anabaena]|uniref:hypothetical protein n=1 Tax=unclassified Anabaena TaxID=2619674 RepID=UPI0039C6ECC3